MPNMPHDKNVIFYDCRKTCNFERLYNLTALCSSINQSINIYFWIKHIHVIGYVVVRSQWTIHGQSYTSLFSWRTKHFIGTDWWENSSQVGKEYKYRSATNVIQSYWSYLSGMNCHFSIFFASMICENILKCFSFRLLFDFVESFPCYVPSFKGK